MTRGLLQIWVGFGLLAALLGWSELPGAAGGRSLQGWWLARQFEAAALDDDSDSLLRLGEQILRRQGSTDALLFAAHRVSYQSTGSSMHLPPAEGRARAEAGIQALEQHFHELEDPWSARRLQADIIVNREVSPALLPFGQQAAQEWFAAGGGPDWPFSHPAQAYRTGLALPPAERPAFYLRCLQASWGED